MTVRALPIVFAAALLGPVVPLVAAQDLPKRKSGLWEIKVDTGAKGAPVMSMTQCVDAAKDDLMRQQGQQMGGEMKCTQSKVQQSAGRISFESACEMGATKVNSKTSITGDFNSAYRMDIQSKYSPPMMGMADATMVMDAKHIGACKPGQRPGDTTMPGGMTMNMYDILEGKKK